MNQIIYIDRQTKKKQREKIYKERAIRFLYGDSLWNRLAQKCLSPLIAGLPLFSKLYGYFQKTARSAKKISSFIQHFNVDSSEFLAPVESFRTFNEFFIRKLKPEARPLDPDPLTAIIPADGRYYFYQSIEKIDHFPIKGDTFDLSELLAREDLATKYRDGSMVMARLCPSDYHRFHFPCDCVPDSTHLINGWLHSVNPIAVKKNMRILTQNKRTLCELHTSLFGPVLYIEVGAMNVGSIQETYLPHQSHKKGDEKGFFEFGGSALILLFLRDTILFDPDLIEATEEGYEIRCLFGQPMGRTTQ